MQEIPKQPDVSWDPLQAGYQDVIDICNEAWMLTASSGKRPDSYEPERVNTCDQTRDAAPIETPPPQPFNKRSRPEFAE